MVHERQRNELIVPELVLVLNVELEVNHVVPLGVAVVSDGFCLGKLVEVAGGRVAGRKLGDCGARRAEDRSEELERTVWHDFISGEMLF